MNIPDYLFSAVEDYKLLLLKEYPPAGTLQLVANRYRLKSCERSVLYRGIYNKDVSIARKKKMISSTEITGKALHIDAMNQVFTVAGYLTGRYVFIASDGFLRDASEIHGDIIPPDICSRACSLIVSFLETSGVVEAVFVIDIQGNMFETIINKLNSIHTAKVRITTFPSKKTDEHLYSLSEGLICSSDTQIIDRSPLQAFDLAASTLLFHFHPVFIQFAYE
ncbi:MAG: DUF434 domain-containing protein [Bacteroidales bacterium]|nr:DUF434 domain-containing protein [Bacteroidales bacterium]